MERFFNNDEEPDFSQFQEGDEEGDEGQEESLYVDQDGLLEVMHVDLAQNELNQGLISKAISIAEKSWFWSFRSTKSKMKEIEEIYQQLLRLTEQEGTE